MTQRHTSTQRHLSRTAQSAGFTLVELMVTVVIASILLSIAIPAYTGQVRKSRRTDARTALLDLASREERYFSTANSYTAVPANLGYSGTFPINVGNNYYALQAPVLSGPTVSPPTFSLQALPVAGSGQDKDTQCASFTVTSTGQQSSLDSNSADSTATCWN
jgi:type IV pilus assembly protein PilE